MIWVSAIGVIASCVIAIAAIWGERIRAAAFRPDLRLELVKATGERERFGLDGRSPGEEFQLPPTSRRIYRLRVLNRARYPAAQEVEVLLTHIDRQGPDGQPQLGPTGSLPLMWRYQALYPRSRVIGYATELEIDLLLASRDEILLAPMEPPTFSLTMYGEQHFWITAVARGLNAQSRPLRLKVDWDGRWDPGDTEMGQHLRVREV